MAGNRNADELLKWGLQHAPTTADGQSSVAQVTDDIAAGRRPDLQDPNLYNAIMGKSEAQMMQEELTVAMDTSRSDEDRSTALDNFEMLIEQVDNTNNMESMQMWPPMLSLLGAPQPEIQLQAAWIVGTAMQNNDKAQAVALGHGVLDPLLALVKSPTPSVRNKAMYAISSLLGHFPAAVAQFAEKDGWTLLNEALQDSSIVLRRKVAFMLNQLLVQDPSDPAQPAMDEDTESTATAVAPRESKLPPMPLEEGPATKRVKVKHPDVAQALVESGILSTLLDSLLPSGTGPAASCNNEPTRNDLDYAEKAVQVIFTLVDKSRRALPLPHDKLLALAQDLEGPAQDAQGGATTRADELSVDQTALQSFKATLA